MGTKRQIRFEKEMVELICRVMVNQGLRVYLEVPCFERNVDIVLQLPSGLVAIECKIRDWKRGLEQARHHMLAFDYCFVCLPSRKLSKETVKTFKDAGIGLLLFDPFSKERLKEVISARRSTEKLQPVQDRILRVIGVGEEESGVNGELPGQASAFDSLWNNPGGTIPFWNLP